MCVPSEEDLWALRDIAKHQDAVVGEQSGVCRHERTYIDIPQGAELCVECGLVVDHILCDIFGNTLPVRSIKPRSLYRRRHHFNERLAQWLVTTRRVPYDVVEGVRLHILNSSDGADVPLDINKTKIRAALRSMKLAKYIENWVEIYCDLSDRPYPQVDSEILERIREHFLAIENAFEKNKPEGRKCILSYNYIICRILQIYGLTEHLKFFPPLKSRAKLKYLDNVWAQMTRTLGLPYIPAPMFNKSLR